MKGVIYSKVSTELHKDDSLIHQQEVIIGELL